MVLPDSTMVHANDNDHAGLSWAARGQGQGIFLMWWFAFT